ncbi:TrkH family potassium uptake protein [Halopiger xanaduensis]|uniref:Cation transporter n=1 Tax=Halopiger xanaduensis (strain DSM 18323 / JCM 14033 / SH-6) TaxID=797210 RepID=F8D7L4_HALXS|nr:TrkH family potassium uptake protein [Halopiger xanaduensis]AEH36497.1 cation transporter [Halopiger xanaduensis SH-6]
MRVEFRTVCRDVGRILQIVSLMMFVSTGIAILYDEFYAIPPLVVAGLVVFGAGAGLARQFSDAPEPNKLHGMLIAAAAWAAVGVLGGLPFLLIAWTIAIDPFPAWANAPALNETTAAFRDPLNGIFESLSGFTSTGLTMARTEEQLPATLLWWRSFTEWIGGVGVIVLTVAILARPGSGSLTLYESEARSTKIHPSIVSTVREIWKIYVILTVGGIALLFVAGMPLWGAINHAMTGIATGGFSIHADSIGHYDSAAIEYAVIPIMVAGSIAFPVHYLLFKGELENFYKDLQTRWVFIWFTVGSLALTGTLYLRGTYDTLEESFRHGLFQFVSGTSNAGFGTTAIGNGAEQIWTADATLIVCAGMLTGAAAGSTVGGIKLIRAITLVRGARWRIAGVFEPSSAVRRLRIGDRSLSETQASKELEEAAIVFVLWLLFLAVGVAVLLATLPTDVRAEYVLFEVMSAQSTVGLSAGITGPEMPTAAKLVFLLNMWVGRLEIIPVLVLFRGALLRAGLYR